MNNANIFIKNSNNTGVYLYSKMGDKLPVVLQNALKRGKDRWGDTPTMTRIIFSEMIQNDVLGNTGFGISNSIMDNDHLILVVDDANCRIGVFGETGRKWISYTYQQFISLTTRQLDWFTIANGYTLEHDTGAYVRTGTDPYVF